MQKTYKSIFISDVHLGTKDCKAKELNDFLKKNSSDNLYLVGDIIDGWKIQQNRLKWKQSHSEVARVYLDNSDRFSNVEEDTRNNKKVIGVRTQKLRGDFTEEERNYIRVQYINHNRMHKLLEKVVGYSDTGKSFILICNKYQPHKDVKINIFRSILS